MSTQKHTKMRTHMRGGGGFIMVASGILLFAICFAGIAGRFAITFFKLK